MSKASPLGIRLFLEGVEVPVISAQVTSAPNKAAVAAIQVIPNGMALHLMPRTLVHLFYLDEIPQIQKGSLKPGETLAEAAARVDAAQAGDPSLNRVAASDNNYRLMFCGEIIGFNYTKTPQGRQLVFQCMDLSSYWDACYQWFADWSPGGTALTDKAHMFVGAGEGLFDNVASGTKWVLGRLLRTPPRTPEYQKARGLLGGVIHLLEAVGGLRPRKKGGGRHGVNDFFTIAEMRYNLLGQLGAIEDDATSVKLYNSKVFLEWLRNGMSSLGNLISFRDVVNHVNKYIFHEVYPNTCPRYLDASEVEAARNFQKEDSTTLEDDVGHGTAALQEMRKTITSLNVASLQFKSASSEKLLGSRQGPFSAGVKALQEASKRRLVAEALVGQSYADDASSVKSKLVEVGSKLDEALKKTQGKTSNLAKLGGEALELVNEAGETLTSLTDLEHRSKSVAPKRSAAEKGNRLFTQLFLPDCYFVSPPRCNVIFPDEYFSFSFNRNFMREVTRLSCQGGMGIIGGDKGPGAAILARHYFSPPVRDAAGRNLHVTLQYGGRLLLRHETHSGIIPKFTWITHGHRWGVKAAKIEGVKVENKIPYVQRLANFQFFLHRWASRTMNLSCVFKPTLVLGLPALVIDKPLVMSGAVQAKYQEALGSAYVPPQFLGKIINLDHNINQNGGQTTVSLSHCRLHQGLDDELLGMLYQETYKKKTKEFDIDYKLMSEDPSYKRGQRTTLSYILRRWLDGKIKKNRPFGQGTIIEVKEGSTVTIRGAPMANLGLPSWYTREGNRVIVPKTLYLKVEVKKGTGEFIRKEGATIEDSLTPGWFSKDVWHRENVGTKVYQFLLGCYSITDDIPVTTRELQERFKKLKKTGGDSYAAAADTFSEGQQSQGYEDVLEAAGQSLGGVIEGSIEEAVNGIATIYGEIRRNKHYNVHEFIRNFTYRPIASIVDILGSADLKFGDDGYPTSDDMVEGFHSRAFGEYNKEVKQPTAEGYTVTPGEDALHLLFPGVSKADAASTEMGSVVDRGEPKHGLQPDFDPRGRSWARVMAYAAEMQVTRGLIG